MGKDLFKERYLDVFMPDGIEFSNDILYSIGYDLRDNSFNKDFQTEVIAKKDGLYVIEFLCDLELIEIFKWGKIKPEFSKTNFKKQQLIDFLKNHWHIHQGTVDFYDVVIFKYKDWYLNALKEKGFTETTYWKTFVKNEIGDLEKWIEEVRPKNHIIKQDEY